MTKILITGGAGYIGSHIVKLLTQKKYQTITLDDLSSGHRDAVLDGDFIQGDVGDEKLVNDIIKKNKPAAVIHLAASIQVEESITNPIKYYFNNTFKTLKLLEVLTKNNINNFIFSSTAAVYGNPSKIPVAETENLTPINPYGNSKKFSEQILIDMANSSGIRHMILRYFNVAGADPEGDLGQRYESTANLIDKTLKVAKGESPKIEIYGTNFKTQDGTCVRDYIHVTDIAQAHLICLEHLLNGGKSNIFNLGYGQGFSVKEIIKIAQKITKINFTVEETKARQADPPIVIADSSKIKATLNWQPQYNDIEYIIKTAWDWQNNKK